MEPNTGMIVRVLKRLKAAVGYHELGMTQHALRCLDSLDLLGKIGPFGVVQDVLRDVFITNPENHVSAANALEVVACMLSTPARHAIQLTLDTCYGLGQKDIAGQKSPQSLPLSRLRPRCPDVISD